MEEVISRKRKGDRQTSSLRKLGSIRYTDRGTVQLASWFA